jgi:hypothetical protein
MTGLLRAACHRARIRATRWLAMTTGHNFAIPRRNSPESCISLAQQRAQGMPGASARPQPCAQDEKAHKHSHHGQAGNARHSPRNGFNGFLRALPGEPGLLSPSQAECESILADLTPASGRQDHTTSPSAGPRSRRKRLPRPAHPAPRFVTIASRPSCEAGRRRHVKMICPTAQGENFSNGASWANQLGKLR